MPPRAWRLWLEDIEQSIARIATYIEGLDFAAFCADQKTVDAVVHNLHILVHGYFTVDLEIVWLTAKHRVPELHQILKRPAKSSRRSGK
ncbi:MAG: hypothetical protein OJF58_000157 [Enhydrobacter sp.]|nr:MAG: hypothetical protein OJF58_000157 [Enhydrobacter sp.]